MEEELSENELEGRMFSILHYSDETKTDNGVNQKDTDCVNNGTQSGLKRYWHKNSEQNTLYQKINNPKGPSTEAKKSFVENVSNNGLRQQYSHNNKEQNASSQNINTPKEPATEIKNVMVGTQQKKDDKNNTSSQDLSIFQQPVSENIKKTVEILENEDLNHVVELVSSDEDEVIEVALPPKPTITIESSDEDTVSILIGSAEKKSIERQQESKTGGNRDITASPVPSVVSSISDDFIRGDCIALNISSKHNNNQSFDFSLHGADLLGQTPTRKKKKKRNKDTSTPITAPVNSTPISVDGCFATPNSKAKNKRQKTKSYRVTGKSIPNPDVYDSDSNQSTNEGNKYPNPYSVTNKSLPSTDVYESDSNPSEIVKDLSDVNVEKEVTISGSSTESPITSTPKSTKKNNTESINTKNNSTSNKTVIDLTETDVTSSPIHENIIMGNVTGLTEADVLDENTTVKELQTCGSTKIPAILNEDLDFDNLKGNNRVCKRRRYSLTTLRAEMEKFYNESWGGEDFNHREIQKNMSRDKNLWHIDPKDRMPSMSKRKTTCSYCNRVGHRDDMCRMKPAVCFMCGSTGHFEPRCPRKICVNCGSPNYMYSTMCRNCSNWHTIRCMECGQNGHPSSHCPDLWRRYHNTINLDKPLEENRQIKKHYQAFCSGCTRRGHFVHTCRISLPFSGLPINSPYVAVYRPVYSPIWNNSFTQNNPNQGNKQNKSDIPQDSNVASVLTPRNDCLKRQSKSPVNHEMHVNKKKNSGTPNDTEIHQRTKSPINNNIGSQKKNQQNKEQATGNKGTPDHNKNKTTLVEDNQVVVKKTPDFISISSENHDERGQIIQDNEVSDTSDVVTSARIYIPNEIVEKLKTEEGDTWLKEATKKNNVTLETDNITFYLSIKGAVGNQEAFQAELRDWIGTKQIKPRAVSESEADVTQESITEQSAMCRDIPKNRNNVLRKLNRAFETLKSDLGDPIAHYRELVYLQNQHQNLLKQKFISPQTLSNNRNNINTMLKKLNMVLLGQAGLADGSGHITALHVLQEKLINFRQKNIPTTMREKIGEHFHCIFTPIPRDDYTDLLNKYYNNRSPRNAIRNGQNNKTFKRPKFNQNNKINIQSQENVNKTNDANSQTETVVMTPLMTKTKNKLLFYHRRLLRTKPLDMVLKKTKTELMKKLSSQITSFEKKCPTSKKSFKKMKKVQEQVQLFLSNI